MHLDVGHACIADFPEQHGNAVDIGLAAYDADLGVQRGLMHHVLAAAKADLQPHWAVIAEPVGQVCGRAVGVVFPSHAFGGQRLQVLGQISLLTVAQALALETAIEIAPGRTG